jgi:hypothetical protein
MWWAVRNLARRQAADTAEYSEVFHGKTAAEWAQHHGLPNLSRELAYYVSARHEFASAIVHPLSGAIRATADGRTGLRFPVENDVLALTTG